MSVVKESPPILYSLQHCPYAMRARVALYKAKQQVLIRAIKLNNKPEEMLISSPKGSVPVLCINENCTIDESLEIMLWALAKNDPYELLLSDQPSAVADMVSLIADFESTFIPNMEAYSCAKRYHDDDILTHRQSCEMQLLKLEEMLSKHRFLFSENESLLDIALFPFIRKFARIERHWYLQSPYPKLRQWLDGYLQSPMFSKVMAKHELWLDHRQDIYFG
ncbi:glutathione S-transferase [Vibrio kyushuensis]|uniref:glutathione S-transferase n=1 Tax=Vibrio kyushuensis TaxID=2910249 RepID=UPI003D098354